MNNKKKRIALAAGLIMATQLMFAPFAMAADENPAKGVVKVNPVNEQTIAENQKLVDARPDMQRQMEKLDRGVVAVKTEKSVFVSWRWLATESADTMFNIYRNGEKLNQEPMNATNYMDITPAEGASYQIAPVTNGTEGEKSQETKVWANNYMDVPIQKPDGGSIQGEDYTYSANDAAVGDVDGDGQYEIILKWDPSNAKDAASSGFTGPCIVDAYKLDGTRLWRINMGKNIRAGAHDTQMMVADFDGDGKAEVAMRTADGTQAGDGSYIGDKDKDWASLDNGKNLQGPLYLTVFEGATGKVLDTVDYDPQTVEKGKEFGDTYGNRSERYLASIAYVDGIHPSMVFARGYYTGDGGAGRTVIASYNLVDGKIQKNWVFDTNKLNDPNYLGQGNHSMSCADIDFDGKDEIIYGAIAVDHDGTAMYSTGLGHGDAQHVGDLIPDRPGLEVYSVHEPTGSAYGQEMRDARTGEILFGSFEGTDVGRGVSADVDPRHPGNESWATGKMMNSKGEVIAERPSIPENFLTWWDADLGRELQDNIYISKWNPEKNKTQNIFTAEGCVSINSTKANPSLTADLFGDWREEVMYPTKDSSALRIFTTTTPTAYRIPTLMQDIQYRIHVAQQNTAYNQPTHLSYYLGYDTKNVPVPQIFVNDGGQQVKNPDLSKKSWDINSLYTGTSVMLAIDESKALNNSVPVRIDNDNENVAPFIEEGRTMVPVRFISEATGATVDFDEATADITVVSGDKTIVMNASKNEYTVNGATKTFDVAPQITSDNRSFLPLRAIAEELGQEVYWNESAQLIVLSDIKTDMSDAAAQAIRKNLHDAPMPDKVELKPVISPDKLAENQLAIYGVEASGNDGNSEVGAVDGDMNTRWSSNGPSWLTVDLGSEQEVAGVAIAMWKGDERIYPFSIEVSADGETWTTALEKTQNDGTTSEAQEYKFAAPVKARYVRYNGDGDTTPDKNYCHISEIVILKK
jgi:rhamnogalacturonan endolyase